VGSLASPVNRMSDLVMYAPTDAPGPLPSIVALTAAAAGLVQVASRDSSESVEKRLEDFRRTYEFLTQADSSGEIPEEEDAVTG
jgi:hypothetical protein